MAVLDFPANPAVGDEFTQNGATYTWTGEAWVSGKTQTPPAGSIVQVKRTPTNNHPPPDGSLKEGELAVEMGDPCRLWVGVPLAIDPSGKKLLAHMGSGDPFVNISGDVMTGLLTLSGAPIADLHAATKKYVDDFAAAAQAFFVNVTGDTMTGDLAIAKEAPKVTLNRTTVAGGSAEIEGLLAGVRRWVARFGNTTAEAGANAGSDYTLTGYDDAGAALAAPILRGKRTTNRLEVAGNPIDALDIATKQYVDAAGAGAVPFDVLAYSGMQVNGDFSVSLENGVTAVAVPPVTNKYVNDLFLVANSANPGALSCQQIVGGSINPGFNHTLRMTATAAYTFATAADVLALTHAIEGNRFQRVMWGGGVNAKPVTIAFWIYSNAAGVMSVAMRNAATNRTYVAEVAVTGGGIWEYKTVTIPGCPDGVWESNTNLGASLLFCFGAGSAGRVAPGAWNASANFIGTGVTNFFGAINNAVQLQGLLILPGSTAPTAAQSSGVMRTAREETALVQRYYRQLVWSMEGYGAPRMTAPHGIPAMRVGPVITRTAVGTMSNIRGPSDHANFVTVGSYNQSTIVVSCEVATPGVFVAVNFVESLSARL
jgi:hypothetical protein